MVERRYNCIFCQKFRGNLDDVNEHVDTVHGFGNRIVPYSPMEETCIDALAGGPMTRDQIVSHTRVPRTTLYDALKKLILRGEVTKSPIYLIDRRKGRPKVVFSLMED